MVIRGVPRAPGPSGSVQKVPLKVEEREKEKVNEEGEKEVAQDEGPLKAKSHIADEIYPRKLIQEKNQEVEEDSEEIECFEIPAYEETHPQGSGWQDFEGSSPSNGGAKGLLREPRSFENRKKTRPLVWAAEVEVREYEKDSPLVSSYEGSPFVSSYPPPWQPVVVPGTEGWRKLKDEVSGRDYFFNPATGATQWEPPPQNQYPPSPKLSGVAPHGVAPQLLRRDSPPSRPRAEQDPPGSPMNSPIIRTTAVTAQRSANGSSRQAGRNGLEIPPGMEVQEPRQPMRQPMQRPQEGHDDERQRLVYIQAAALAAQAKATAEEKAKAEAEAKAAAEEAALEAAAEIAAAEAKQRERRREEQERQERDQQQRRQQEEHKRQQRQQERLRDEQDRQEREQRQRRQQEDRQEREQEQRRQQEEQERQQRKQQQQRRREGHEDPEYINLNVKGQAASAQRSANGSTGVFRVSKITNDAMWDDRAATVAARMTQQHGAATRERTPSLYASAPQSATLDRSTTTSLKAAGEVWQTPQVDDDELCCVCRTNPKTIFILPCKHWCICKNCQPAVTICPICLGPVASMHRLVHRTPGEEKPSAPASVPLIGGALREDRPSRHALVPEWDPEQNVALKDHRNDLNFLSTPRTQQASAVNYYAPSDELAAKIASADQVAASLRNTSSGQRIQVAAARARSSSILADRYDPEQKVMKIVHEEMAKDPLAKHAASILDELTRATNRATNHFFQSPEQFEQLEQHKTASRRAAAETQEAAAKRPVEESNTHYLFKEHKYSSPSIPVPTGLDASPTYLNILSSNQYAPDPTNENLRRLQGCFLQEQSDKTKERLEKLKAEIHEKKLRLLALKASTKSMESPEREETKPQDLLKEKYSSRSAPAPAMLKMQMQLQRSEEVSEEAILAASLKDIEILRMRAPSPDSSLERHLQENENRGTPRHHQKGICDVCRMPVLEDQLRTKNNRGAYVHAQCAAAHPYAGGRSAQVHAPHLDARSAPHLVSAHFPSSEIEGKLRAFYAHMNPGKEDKVLMVLQKYRGDLDGLNAELRSKYSVDLNSPSVQLQYTKWLTLGRQ